MYYQTSMRVDTRRRRSDPEISASGLASFQVVTDDFHAPFDYKHELANTERANTKDKKGTTQVCPLARRLPLWYIAIIFVFWIILQCYLYSYMFTGANKSRSRTTISIVWYKPYHAIINHHLSLVDMTRCRYSNCKLKVRQAASTAGNVQLRSDAVIFQGNNLPANTAVTRANSDQVLVFLSYEPPVYIHSSVYTMPQWDGIFNWTMTYRLDSDIVYKYGDFVKKRETNATERDDKSRYSRIYNKKKKFAAWIVSHCETQSRREDVVRELQQYVNVDVFGACFDGKDCSYNNQEPCLAEIERDYKFYLAFENSLCKDYVTEKAYNWTERNIIPVVRGPTDYQQYLPPGSYIDASQFSSVKELAFYLMDVGFHEEEYVRFLKAKDQFKLVPMYKQPQIAYCKLCKRLNNVNKYRRSYTSISQWWNGIDVCWAPTDIH